MQRADVVRVVDGDTIRVILDGVEEPVRFYGIDTRERGEPCFGDATDRTRQLAGETVLLKADARNRDRNGRLLRYVYTPDGVSIDALLVAEGYAYAWRDDGALRQPLINLENAAATANAGCLWSP
jgi:micrococcal nuclease